MGSSSSQHGRQEPVLAVRHCYSPWRTHARCMLSSTRGVMTQTSVKWANQCTSLYLITPALQLVCMHVFFAVGDRPFPQKAFKPCFVCTCVRRLTSSTALGAAGALGHICLLRRGHHRHCHPTGHLLSSRERRRTEKDTCFDWIMSSIPPPCDCISTL